MFTRIVVLAVASMLFLTSLASAEGVITGQTAELSSLRRAAFGPSSYVIAWMDALDFRVLKLTPQEVNILTATQMLLPNAVIVLQSAKDVSGRTDPVVTTPVIVVPIARSSEPAPVVIITDKGSLDAGTTANVYAADVVPVSALQPGSPVVVAGGEPVVREEGYYVRGGPSDRAMWQTIRLTNGKWVTIRDRLLRETGTLEGEVDFDPAALQPGTHITLIKREDGSYFLSAAPAPRPRLVGVPSGKVASVDPRANVLEMSDGSLVHSSESTGLVLSVRDQAIDPSTMVSRTWVVIDPNPALAVEAPSALPADVIMSGTIWDVR